MTQESLKKSKDLSKRMSMVQNAVQAVIGVAKGGTVGNIIKIIVIVLGIGLLFFVKGMIKNLKIKYAAKMTEQEKQELKKYLDYLAENNDDQGVVDLERTF